MKTVAQKMGIKENSRAILINTPEDAIKALELPTLTISNRLSGTFDYIHLFVTKQAGQEDIFEKLKSHLSIDGMLWVSWPKSRQLGSDLTLPKVIHIGYGFGLVESICLSVNDTWSALKFTHPKKGKTYKNSHAQLQSRTTHR